MTYVGRHHLWPADIDVAGFFLDLISLKATCYGHFGLWHLTDNPTVPAFVGYFTNNRQWAVLGPDGSAAIDPERIMRVHGII